MRRWRHHAAQHLAATPPIQAPQQQMNGSTTAVSSYPGHFSRPSTSGSNIASSPTPTATARTPVMMDDASSSAWVTEALSMVPLPPGWLRCSDTDGRTYYHHQPTATSSWLHPLHHHFERLQSRAQQSGLLTPTPPASAPPIVSSNQSNSDNVTDSSLPMVTPRPLTAPVVNHHTTGHSHNNNGTGEVDIGTASLSRWAPFDEATSTARLRAMSAMSEINPMPLPRVNRTVLSPHVPRRQIMPIDASLSPSQTTMTTPLTFPRGPPVTYNGSNGNVNEGEQTQANGNGVGKRDANGLTIRPPSPPKRTEVQQVNEALRTKLSQMVVLRQKLERTLSGTRLESNRVGNHIRDLTLLLQRAERTVQTTANRIALRDQAEKDVADPLDVEFDRCLAAEFHEAQFSCRKLTNYLNYGQQVHSYLADLTTRLQSQLADTLAIIQLDRQCLHLSYTPSSAPVAPLDSSAFSQSARRRLATSSTPTSIATIQALLDHDVAIKQSANDFNKRSVECLKEERAVLRELTRRTQVSIRSCIRQSGQIKHRILQEVLANRAKIPVAEKTERALKAALAAEFKPLEVCQRRYELRMERHDGDMVRDVVQEKLELELQSLGLKVQDLETQLRTTQEELQALQDIDAQLNHQLMMETNLQGIYTTALRMGRSARKATDGETKGDDNDDTDDEEEDHDDGGDANNGESKTGSRATTRGLRHQRQHQYDRRLAASRSANGSMTARPRGTGTSSNIGSIGQSHGPTSEPTDVAMRRGRRGSWAEHLSEESRRMIEGRLHPRIRAKLDAQRQTDDEKKRRVSQNNANMVAAARAEAHASVNKEDDDDDGDHQTEPSSRDISNSHGSNTTDAASTNTYSFRHKFRLPPPTHADRPISPDDLPTDATIGDGGLLHRKLKPSIPHFSYVRTTPKARSRRHRRVSITDDDDDDLDDFKIITSAPQRRTVSPDKLLPKLAANSSDDPNAVVVIAGGAASRRNAARRT